MSRFGKFLEVSLFGASHEEQIGITIHNYPSGIKISTSNIKNRLAQRRGLNKLTSKRFEEDEFEIISGYFKGFTTGAPLTILIKNKDIQSKDYEDIKDIARPSHADYTYFKKFSGYNDYRGGGTASGRLTIALVVLGALCEQILSSKGLVVASRVKQIKHLKDNDLPVNMEVIKDLKEEVFPTFSPEIKNEMLDLIKQTKQAGNSLGAIIETYIAGVPVGLGEPFFDSFESILAHLVFSIPGVKGLEFGSGFDFVRMFGSESNDQIRIKDGQVNFLSNHNGGINGGITNGDLVVFRTVFKPTSSININQKTINLQTNENIDFKTGGRHDTIFAIKGLHVLNAVTNYAVLELLLGLNLWKI